MHNPGQAHRNIVKHTFRYVLETQDNNITFTQDKPSSLVDYTNLDYIGCLESQESTSEQCFKFEYRSILWRSKLPDCTTTSTMEAEYIAALDVDKEAL